MHRYERWINEETIGNAQQISALRFVEFPLVESDDPGAKFELFRDGFSRHVDLPEDYDLMLRPTAQGMRQVRQG